MEKLMDGNTLESTIGAGAALAKQAAQNIAKQSQLDDRIQQNVVSAERIQHQAGGYGGCER